MFGIARPDKTLRVPRHAYSAARELFEAYADKDPGEVRIHITKMAAEARLQLTKKEMR